MNCAADWEVEGRVLLELGSGWIQNLLLGSGWMGGLHLPLTGFFLISSHVETEPQKERKARPASASLEHFTAATAWNSRKAVSLCDGSTFRD